MKSASRILVFAAAVFISAAARSAEEMTNRKAQSICGAVVKAVNDGSIAGRFLKFEVAGEENERRWRASHPDDSLDLSQILKFTRNGKSKTFGMLIGGGTCSSCQIVDIDARETELYPPDDEKEERLRWASWGACDHLLMIEGEPVVVTGSFGGGRSRASLVAWIAPDGAKRALCYLAPSGGIDAKVLRSDNRELCSAVAAGTVDDVSWTDSVALEERDGYRADPQFEGFQAAQIDIDMDGKTDTVVRFEFSSGAGCGSFRQWLRHAVKKGRSDSHALVETSLDRALRESAGGPIEGSSEKDGLWSLKMFTFGGRPYILGRGAEASASVISVWSGTPRTWCEFDLLPQHRVELYYPIETWPASGAAQK